MKKTLFTLCVDDFAPEITDITFPLMQRYADKIGADFHVIRDRRWPDAPVTYEKFQIHDLGREMGNDWNIFFDADTFIHPDMFDLTAHLPKDTVFHWGVDPASIRFRSNEYFQRDGRNIGSCTWSAICSDWTLDLWRPTQLPFEDIVSNIFPTQGEKACGLYQPHHFIDDYLLSCNIARHGLKVTTFDRLCRSIRMDPCSFVHHAYTETREEKAKMILALALEWKLIDPNAERLVFTP